MKVKKKRTFNQIHDVNEKQSNSNVEKLRNMLVSCVIGFVILLFGMALGMLEINKLKQEWETKDVLYELLYDEYVGIFQEKFFFEEQYRKMYEYVYVDE